MLVLLRHGQTEANAGGLLLGRADLPLSDVGRHQAASAAAALGPVGRVVCSPLQRARETAAAFGVPVHVDERWIELDYGEYDQMKVGEVPVEVWAKWRADAEFRPPGGESLVEVAQRVRLACEELVEEASAADVVVVSHVSPIKAAVAWALDVGEGVAFRMHLEVAAVCRIAMGPVGPVLRSFNEPVAASLQG